jgi:hypothetical protein
MSVDEPRERYIRHATLYGSLRDCWESAVRDELEPVALGKLALALRELASRQKPCRKGRTVAVERFSLGRGETAALVRRLIEAGVADADVRRYTGASQSMVRTIRRQADLDSRNTASPAGSPSTRARKAARAPMSTLRSHDPRTCAWCGALLQADLRADANYCPGGKCKQAGHRARREQPTRRAA